MTFLEQECDDPASPLFGVPEASLLAEFAAPDQARRVLEAVGSGQRTHATIAAAAGNVRTAIPSGSLSPLLRRLVDDKRSSPWTSPSRPGRAKPALDARVVGGWWNRRFDPEIDLIGADRGPVAGSIGFVGSVKWLGTPFDRHDLTALHRSASAVPGFEATRTAYVIVSRTGVAAGIGRDEVAVVWDAADVVDAWR